MEDILQESEIDSRASDKDSSVLKTNGQRAEDRPKSKTGQVLVGIPAFNEEISIGSTVLAVKQHVSDVVVVDDGSRDQTAEIAKQAGATVVIHDRNKGKGEAIQTIFDYAQIGEWGAVVLLDGDGQHFPEDIPTVVEPVVDATVDMVIGSRYSEDADNDETPLYRRMGQRILDYLTIGSSGVNVSDSQSGFRALSREAIEQISLSSSGYGVESEMLSVAAEAGLRIDEQPINVRYEDIDGQSNNPLAHGLTVISSLLYIARDKRPLLIFGVPGLVLALLGMAYGVQGILIYQTSGTFYPAKAMLSGFLLIIGVISGFCGLLLSQMKNIMSDIIDQANN